MITEQPFLPVAPKETWMWLDVTRCPFGAPTARRTGRRWLWGWSGDPCTHAKKCWVVGFFFGKKDEPGLQEVAGCSSVHLEESPGGSDAPSPFSAPSVPSPLFFFSLPC